jgi:hypothetical protein
MTAASRSSRGSKLARAGASLRDVSRRGHDPTKKGSPLADDEQKNNDKSNFCHDDLNQIARFRR